MPETARVDLRAMLVTRNFPPLLGGMETVNKHILSELAREWDIALCGPAGAAAHSGDAVVVAEFPTKPLWRFVPLALWRALRMARSFRPSVVIAGSGLTAPMAWLAAWSCGARVGVYLHGLDVIAERRIYQALWLPFIRRCDAVLVNSQNTSMLAQQAGVEATRITLLHPGVRSPELDLESAVRFRAAHGLQTAELMLSVGRLTQRKGLVEFITHCMPTIVSQRPSAALVVIGTDAVDALKGRKGSERERILAAASAAGVLAAVRMLGRCDDATLSGAYQAAAVHVFPVLDLPGDVEGFGMVALEAAAHGLSTVAFDVGGVADAVLDGVTGDLVAPGDYRKFAARVIARSDPGGRRVDMAENCRRFSAKFEWSLFGATLRRWADSLSFR